MFCIKKYNKLTQCPYNILRNSSSGKLMNKILKDTKSKKKWKIGDGYVSETVPLPSNLAQGASEGKRSVNSKRVSVLNKLFMRHVTDLMATGNNSNAFLGRGIQINRIMVTPDFKGVNIFWMAKGTEKDNEIEQLLSQNAGVLRHELSQLRVMGVVPKINFVKDKTYAKLIEVDERLTKADFGSDYIPVEPSYRFKSGLSLDMSISEAVKTKIENLEEDPDLEEELPEMRNDIFGLNRAEIIAKVQKSMKKSQATHRKNDTQHKLSTNINENPVEYENNKQQREAFQQFLLKRQIQKAKAQKEKDKYNPEYEYLRENFKYYEETPFSEEIKDEDYIEEETQNVKM